MMVPSGCWHEITVTLDTIPLLVGWSGSSGEVNWQSYCCSFECDPDAFFWPSVFLGCFLSVIFLIVPDFMETFAPGIWCLYQFGEVFKSIISLNFSPSCSFSIPLLQLYEPCHSTSHISYVLFWNLHTFLFIF